MRFGKNAIIWLLAFVALSFAMSFMENKNFSSGYENLAFSDFMNEVKGKRISGVTMTGAQIYSVQKVYDLCSVQPDNS